MRGAHIRCVQKGKVMLSASEISRELKIPISQVLRIVGEAGIEPEIRRVNLSLFDLQALERVREVLAAEQAVRTVNAPEVMA
jgi:hypothetical protein